MAMFAGHRQYSCLQKYFLITDGKGILSTDCKWKQDRKITLQNAPVSKVRSG